MALYKSVYYYYNYGMLLLLYVGIVFSHYDAAFSRRKKLCLAILKQFGFGQRVMESRIITEVDDMVNKVRETQGQPFDPTRLTTCCVANVVVSILFGRRFEHSDAAFQQLLSDIDDLTSNFSHALETFPALRFLPYFRKLMSKANSTTASIHAFINDNIDACTQVSSLRSLSTVLAAADTASLFCCCFLFIFNDFCRPNYLEIYRTELYQIFRVGRTVAVDDQSEISFSIPRGMLPWQPIFASFIRRTEFR